MLDASSTYCAGRLISGIPEAHRNTTRATRLAMKSAGLAPWQCRLVGYVPFIGPGQVRGTASCWRPHLSSFRSLSVGPRISSVQIPRHPLLPRATAGLAESDVIGFSDLGLGPELLSGLAELGVSTPTPIQVRQSSRCSSLRTFNVAKSLACA